MLGRASSARTGPVSIYSSGPCLMHASKISTLSAHRKAGTSCSTLFYSTTRMTIGYTHRDSHPLLLAFVPPDEAPVAALPWPSRPGSPPAAPALPPLDVLEGLCPAIQAAISKFLIPALTLAPASPASPFVPPTPSLPREPLPSPVDEEEPAPPAPKPVIAANGPCRWWSSNSFRVSSSTLRVRVSAGG